MNPDRSAAGVFPWSLATGTEAPWHLKARLTPRFLVSYPWQRWRCRHGLASPLGRFSARHYLPRRTLLRWHHGLRATDFAGLITDPDRTIRSRADSALRDRGTTPTARTRAEELHGEAAADLARRLGVSNVPLGMHVNLGWWLWVNHGDAKLLDRLTGHGEPSDEEPMRTFSRLALGQASSEQLHEAAIAAAVPPTVRARAVEPLVARGAVADDPAKAAHLYLLAGLPSEYRRIDPDGSLLAAEYLTMDTGQRALLRTVLTDLGEHDLVRLLHRTSRSRLAVPAETGDSPDDRDRWFRACLSAPVIDAAEAARSADGKPRDDGDRRLLELLLRTDAAALRTSRERLAGVSDHSLDLPAGTTGIGRTSFSPDGTRLAVEVLTRSRDHRIVEYAVPTRQVLAERLGPSDRDLLALLHTGRGLAAIAWADPLCRLSFLADGAVRPVAEFAGEFGQDFHLAPLRDGFMYHRYDGLRFLDSTAEPRHRDRSGLGVAADSERVVQIAAGPDGRFAAVLYDSAIRVYDVRNGELRCGSAGPFDAAAVAFPDPDTIISIKDHWRGPLPGNAVGGPTLKRWAVHGTEVVEQASRKFDVPSFHWGSNDTSALYRLSDGDRLLAVIPANERASHSDALIAVDAATLDKVHVPQQPGWQVRAASPDTRTFLCAARFGNSARLNLRTLAPHPLAAIVDTAMADLEPSDLAVVERELARAEPTAKPLVELLYHCLRHRFRDEIALGEAVSGTGHDIHLGGDR